MIGTFGTRRSRNIRRLVDVLNLDNLPAFGSLGYLAVDTCAFVCVVAPDIAQA